MKKSAFNNSNLVALNNRLYPRILSQVDHDPHSPTYGACDRAFWMYRLHDFNSGIIQQPSLYFALLTLNHNEPSEKKLFWANLAKAINTYSVGIANTNGSFDEYYPGEHSYVATAFTSYAILKSAIILNQDEIVNHPKLARSFEKFLTYSPSPAANQDISFCAFAALYSQTLNMKAKETKFKIQEFLKRKMFNGEFSEYGGFDLGYASVTLNYLSYMDQDGFVDVKEHIKKLSASCADFVSRSGFYGGEYASRSTAYCLPYGFYYASTLFPELASHFCRLDLEAIFERIDDRYLIHYLAPSLAYTLTKTASTPFPTTHELKIDDKYGVVYDSAFFLNLFEKNFYLGLQKGGCFYFESKEGKIYHDSGYRIEQNNQFYSSSTFNKHNRYTFQESEGIIQIKCEAVFSRYRILTASPLKTIILRLLSFMGGKLNIVFKRLLIKEPIHLKDVKLIRHISINKNTGNIHLKDKIQGAAKGLRITNSPPSTFRLVPSAKFTMKGEEEAFLITNLGNSLPWEKEQNL